MTGPKHKLLVVDDDAALCQLLKAGLEMHGFSVQCETYAINTIPACLDFHPDLVMLDVDMPVKDGGQVAAELQRHPTLRRTPVVFLTSLASKAETAQRDVAGEIILSKQLSMAELVGGLRAVLQPRTPQFYAGVAGIEAGAKPAAPRTNVRTWRLT